jgi:hypothetical protein
MRDLRKAVADLDRRLATLRAGAEAETRAREQAIAPLATELASSQAAFREMTTALDRVQAAQEEGRGRALAAAQENDAALGDLGARMSFMSGRTEKLERSHIATMESVCRNSARLTELTNMLTGHNAAASSASRPQAAYGSWPTTGANSACPIATVAQPADYGPPQAAAPPVWLAQMLEQQAAAYAQYSATRHTGPPWAAIPTSPPGTGGF